MKGVSTFVAAIILVLISVSIGIIIYAWMRGLIYSTSQEQIQQTMNYLECQKAGIRIERIEYCSNNLLNFTLRNVGKADINKLLASVKFKDGSILNFDDIKECFKDNSLTLKSGEKKCGHLYGMNFTNAVELSVVIKDCPSVYDVVEIVC